MKHIKVWLVQVYLIILPIFSMAQTTIADDGPALARYEELIEELARNDNSVMDYSFIIDRLRYYAEHPINLNTDELLKLKELYLLSDIQINNLINYRKKYGNLASIYELHTIEGFETRTIQRLQPFITCVRSPAGTLNDLRGHHLKTVHTLLFRYARVLEKQAGYRRIDSLWKANPNLYYIGKPDKLLLKYKVDFRNRIIAGLIAEKDAGECFFCNQIPDTMIEATKNVPNPGFDFYSAYIWIRDLSCIRSLVLGDYHAQFGQGLTMWTGFGFGKPPDAVSVKKYGRGIRPNTSANEYSYFRGAATTLRFGKFGISAFYSGKKHDARTTNWDTINQTANQVSTIYQTGYHRTLNELIYKQTLKQTTYGGHLSYQAGRYHVGATFVYTHFRPGVFPSPELYKLFGFRGQALKNMGIDFNLLLGKMNLFGEFALAQPGGLALLFGGITSLHAMIDLAFIYRNYRRNYKSFYTGAFSENAEPSNETGVYLGLHCRLNSSWSVSGYIDFFRFPWLKYGVDAPSTGHEAGLRIDFHPDCPISMYLRYKHKTKQANLNNEFSYLQTCSAYSKHSLRLEVESVITEKIRLRNRVEIQLYKKHTSSQQQGYLIFQDLIYNVFNDKLKFYFRYAVFDIANWDTRIYTYEQDVFQAFSIPFFYDQGTRVYCLIRISLLPNLKVWFRLAQSIYEEKNTIGSGLDQIEGNKKTEVKAQFIYRIR